MRQFIAAASILALAACGLNGTDRYKDDSKPVTTASTAAYPTMASDNLADPMASHDGQQLAANIPDPEQRPVMQAQVALDRVGFGPGVIDGKMGMSTHNALKGFQEANSLKTTGEIDDPTKQAMQQWQSLPATRVVSIPNGWGQTQYYKMPDKAEDQAKMQRLGYSSLDERLAERFHTTIDVLKQLNPGGRPAGMTSATETPTPGTTATPMPSAMPTMKSTPTPTSSASGIGAVFTPQRGPASLFTAGQQIRVPNIGADRIAPGAVDDSTWQQTLVSLGVGSEQPKAAKVVVSKSGGTLKAYDEADKLIAEFTVTSGSSHDPLPLGDWKVTGVARNTPFAYDPTLFWDVADSEAKQKLPPGPNGPVGVVWIDLNKEHYGIHGTPEPQTIGRTQSHGCVRLTNWDAARLAQMVSTSTKVEFVA